MLSFSSSGTTIACSLSQARPFNFLLPHTMSDVSKPDKKAPAANRRCSQCGLTLPLSTPVGMCPKCLLLGVPDAELESAHDPAATIPTPGPRPATGAAARPPAWQPPTAEELQEMLPQYEVMELLGRGGMGAVYKGRQIALDRLVAIKILQPDIGEEEHNFAGRFNLEARAMAKMKHPGIVSVHDFGQTAQGLLYFVMELVEGMDVQRMIAQEGRLHSANAVSIAAHVCEALQYAHERGIIHRDIKPANVIVDYDGHVKVADFGLVKVMNAGPTSTFTVSGNVMGTPHYMAPEALVLGASVDQRADIYAVGVMLYHMLTGRLPQGMFELPSLKVPGLDPRLDGIIARAMRENRDQRYQSATELRFDLVNILTQPVPQTIPLPPQEDTESRPPRRAAAPVDRPRRIMAAAREEEEDDDVEGYEYAATHQMLQTTSSLNTTMLVLGSIALLTIGALALFLANRKSGDVISTVTTITNSTTTNSYFTQIIATGATTLEELQAIAEIRPYGYRFIGITKEAFSWTQVQDIARRTGAQIMTVDEGAERGKLLAWVEESYNAHLSSTAVWVQEKGEARAAQSKEIISTTDLTTPRKALLEWRVPQTTGGATSTTTQFIQQTPPPTQAPAAQPVLPASNPAVPLPTPAPSASPATTAIHAWIAKDGRVIQAKFIKLDGEGVVIEKDGTTFTVPFTNLSPASVELARQLGALPK